MKPLCRNLSAQCAIVLSALAFAGIAGGAVLSGAKNEALHVFLVGAAVSAFVLITSWIVIDRFIIRPLRQLKASIVGVTELGRHGQRLIGIRNDEIGEVATAIDEMKGALEELRKRSRALCEGTSDAVITFNSTHTIVSANSPAEAMFGLPVKEFAGKPITALLPDLRSMMQSGGSLKDAETSAYRNDGKSFPVEVNLTQFELRGEVHHVVMVHDITGRKEQAAAVERLAMHDSLTSLPNRALFFERLRTNLQYASVYHEPLAVIVVNLRRFKNINDTLGHTRADQLVKAAASRLLEVARENDTVARLGGDEFALSLPFSNEDTATWVVRRIAKAFEKPFSIGSQSYVMGVRCGIALAPKHTMDPGELVRYADIASHAAAARTEGYAFYASDLDTFSEDRLHLLSELRGAITKNELRLHYQPQVDILTRQVVGVEALVRWQHPKHGLLMPGQFVPDAELYGMTRQMTGWVIEEAIQQRAKWLKEGIDINVSVNLSIQDLEDTEFADWMANMIASHQSGSNSAGICLEVTETMMIEMPDRVQRALAKLVAAGAKISIDDFGTGFASLTYLCQMPLSEVKIDRSFVMEMLRNNGSETIVRAVIDMAHNLGHKVVAEGVSEEEIFDRLKELGCDIAQGFQISKPKSAEELSSWLRTSGWWNGRSKSLRVVSSN